MISLPRNAEKLKIENATVDFFEFQKNNLTYYYFDTSLCASPEPMLNAMIGLQLLNSDTKRLIMINHQAPVALFPRIDENFEYEINNKEEDFEIIFKYKEGRMLKTDFSENGCDS